MKVRVKKTLGDKKMTAIRKAVKEGIGLNDNVNIWYLIISPKGEYKGFTKDSKPKNNDNDIIVSLEKNETAYHSYNWYRKDVIKNRLRMKLGLSYMTEILGEEIGKNEGKESFVPDRKIKCFYFLLIDEHIYPSAERYITKIYLTDINNSAHIYKLQIDGKDYFYSYPYCLRLIPKLDTDLRGEDIRPLLPSIYHTPYDRDRSRWLYEKGYDWKTAIFNCSRNILIELINNQLKYISNLKVDDRLLMDILYIIDNEMKMSKNEIAKEFLSFLYSLDITNYPNCIEGIKKLTEEG